MADSRLTFVKETERRAQEERGLSSGQQSKEDRKGRHGGRGEKSHENFLSLDSPPPPLSQPSPEPQSVCQHVSGVCSAAEPLLEETPTDTLLCYLSEPCLRLTEAANPSSGRLDLSMPAFLRFMIIIKRMRE